MVIKLKTQRTLSSSDMNLGSKMQKKEEVLNYIQQEETDISYVKVGNGGHIL